VIKSWHRRGEEKRGAFRSDRTTTEATHGKICVKIEAELALKSTALRRSLAFAGEPFFWLTLPQFRSCQFVMSFRTPGRAVAAGVSMSSRFLPS